MRLARPAAAAVLSALAPFAATPATCQDLVVNGGATVTNAGGTENYEDGFVGLDPTGTAPNPSDSGTYRVTDGGTTAFAGRVRVGEANGGFGSVDVTGAGSELSTDFGFVLENAAMSVTGGGTARGGVFVGNAADADLTVSGGGRFEALGAVVGVQSGVNGTLTVTGPGSVYEGSQTLSIAGLGGGTGDVSDGGRLASNVIVVGDQAGSAGNLFLDGAGSEIEAAVGMGVGAQGFGSLDATGGSVTVGDNVVIGIAAGSRGIVGLRDASLNAGGSAFVGFGGTGSLFLNSGASGTVAGGLNVGVQAGAVGSVQVGGGGGGTALTVGGLALGGDADAAGGTGSLTLLDGGTLTVDGFTDIYAGGTLEMFGGTLVNNGSFVTAAGGTFSTASGGTLAGAGGSFDGTVTADLGLTLAPGAAAGQADSLSFGNLALGAAAYEWDLGALPGDGVPIDDWDLLSVADTLTFAATAADPFTVLVRSLPTLAGFDPSRTYQWSIAQFENFAGPFDPAAVNFDTSRFAPDLGGGMFFASVDDGNLYANFAPAAVPEPGTWVLLLFAAGAGGTARRHRRAELKLPKPGSRGTPAWGAT